MEIFVEVEIYNIYFIWTGDYLDDLGESVDSGRSSVRISVSRGDLGVNFECRAYHPTIEGHFTKFLQLEVDGEYDIV